MPGLVLKLAPKERLLVNGVVLENGDRRSRITVMTPAARILRLRDALHPDEATTPVRRVCYILQLALSGDVDEQAAHEQVLDGIAQLEGVFSDQDSKAHLSAAAEAVSDGTSYRALKILRLLIPREARLLEAH